MARRVGCSWIVTSREDDPLTAYAGQVSHDLKNPLASIRMSLELLRDELATDDPELLDLLARADRGVRRMTDLIDDLTLRAHEIGDPPTR